MAMTIKRHPALQPFSRDHLIGLYHAQRLKRLDKLATSKVVADTMDSFSQAYRREIAPHFADEDRIIASLPISPENLKRLHDEHAQLVALIEKCLQNQDDRTLARRVGDLLDEHIRWEEHELFPEIETTLSEDGLAEVGKETATFEQSRTRRL
jgi:hypothetical protein